MAKLPSIELLENTHTFPGKYVFKVIGMAEGDFAERVVGAVVVVLSEKHGAIFSQRPSGSGRHVAVSIEVGVESAAVVHLLYEEFLQLQGLVMVL